MTTLTLDQLAAELINAKALENKAKETRIMIEEKIIEMVGIKEEGSSTTKLESGLKVTVTGKITYSADMELLAQLCQALPANMHPIKTKVELDTTGAKFIRNNEPEIWKMLAAAITIKPAKPSVEIKA
jgi:hypothetical protein